MSLEIEETRIGAAALLAPSGRLDTNTAKVLEARLSDLVGGDANALVIDMGGVDYVSSFGLRVILSAAKKLAAQKRPFVLHGLQTDVANVFRISGFLKILTVVEDRPAALAAAGVEE